MLWIHLLALLNVFADFFTNLAGPVLIPAVATAVMWLVAKNVEFQGKLSGYLGTAWPILVATAVGAIGKQFGWDVSGPDAFAGSFVGWLGMILGIKTPAPAARALRG